jgi:hypothetical protein
VEINVPSLPCKERLSEDCLSASVHTRRKQFSAEEEQVKKHPAGSRSPSGVSSFQRFARFIQRQLAIIL